MENKVQELTQKLYEEGLEKGRSEAGRLVDQARAEAEAIVARAKAEAAEIVSKAEIKAQEQMRNTKTEITLAARQITVALREMIVGMVTSRIVDLPTTAMSLDEAFLREMILTVARNWNGSSETAAQLTATLPEQMRTKFEAAADNSIAELLKQGIELHYSNGMKSGFKIGPRDGGYHISFAEEDLRALLGCYLRPRIMEMLYTQDEH